MTSLLAVKLVRDLRAVWPRLLAMVVAIAVSLIVFGAVLCSWAAIGRETAGAYSSTAPASATIVFDQDLDAATMSALAAEARDRPGVLDATARTQFHSELAVNGEPRTTPVQVFVAEADDPMTVARFDVEQGRWPPAAGEILVRRDALTLMGVAVGDTMTLTGPNGDPLTLRVAGTVYDPSLAPSPQQQTGAAYLSAASLPGPVRLDQLKLQIADPGGTIPTADRDTAVATARAVGGWLRAEHSVAIREIQVPEPYAHPHQWQADTLLLSLLAGGAASLLLATILVATMLNGLFIQQIPQIGILKAIGARAGRIGRLYLAMTLTVAGAATALAIGPAILLGRAGVRAFTGFLGVEPVSLTAPGWTYAVIIALGLTLPPLLAVVPLVKASRTTVRAAIDHHGTGVRAGAASGLLARLSRSRRLDRGLLMALRNTVRRPARFLLSVGLLASAGTVFVAGMSLNSGTQAIDDERKAQRTWDVEVQLEQPAARDRVASIVAGVPGVSKVEGFRRTQTGVAKPGEVPVTRTYPDQGHGSINVTAITVGSTMLPPPPLLEGRWLTPGETGAVVLNQITRNTTVPDARVGDTVQLVLTGRPTAWRVVGLVQEREGGSGGTYVTVEGFAAATGTPEQVDQVRVAIGRHDEQARTQAATAVERALTAAGLSVRTAASVSRTDAVSAGHLGPVLLILLGVAIPLGLIGIIGLASTMGANVLERIREFGVLHAIGARPRVVRRIVVAEGVFLALASYVLAILPTLGLTAFLGDGLGNLFMSAPLPFRISVPAAVIWLALVSLGAFLATEAAASRAARLTVLEALSYL